jgi:ribosomal-protein-alanine N-acetyltransferase
MSSTLETPRMILRPFQLTDAPVIFTWVGDPEIQRFLYTGPDLSLEQTVARVERYISYQQQYGFSRWLIFDRATGTPIGDAGLLMMPDGVEIELGYRFAKPWWGQGRATEVAAAWLNYAFGPLNIPALVAFAEPENHASIRVMQKIGMRFLRREQLYGKDEIVYGIQRPQRDEEEHE